MGGVRTPRSVKGAQALCERFAVIEGEIALIEGLRNACIASANAEADAGLEPLLAERAQIAEKLEPWWRAEGPSLVKGKRKSIELGGCLIGTRLGKSSLVVPDDLKAAMAGLGKAYLRVTTSLDRVAIGKALAQPGAKARALLDKGFALREAEEAFVLERIEQEGTRA